MLFLHTKVRPLRISMISMSGASLSKGRLALLLKLTPFVSGVSDSPAEGLRS
jgi:hypothetical protein